jgi:hypothetical protein
LFLVVVYLFYIFWDPFFNYLVFVHVLKSVGGGGPWHSLLFSVNCVILLPNLIFVSLCLSVLTSTEGSRSQWRPSCAPYWNVLVCLLSQMPSHNLLTRSVFQDWIMLFFCYQF